MSGANEYPLGGDLTDERVSGMLHTTLERLARRVSNQNFQLFQLLANGPDSFGLGNQVMAPHGSDWRDAGQGADCKVMDMSFGDFDSTWRLNSPGCGGTSSVTPDKYKAPKLPGAPVPAPWPPAPMPSPGIPHPGPKGGSKRPNKHPQPMYNPGNPHPASFPRGGGIGTPLYQQGYVLREPSGDHVGLPRCQSHATKFRQAVTLAAASVPATTYIQGQIRGYLPGAAYRSLKWGPNGISLDLKAKAVWATPSEGDTKKVFMYVGVQQPNCNDYGAYISESTTSETEGDASLWSPWDAVPVPAGTAMSQQYDPQQHPGLALGPDWRGGDLLVMDVKIYTDGDVGHTLSELELSIGELTLDVNYA